MAQRVYMDWAATAPLCEEAKCAMEPFWGTGEQAYAANLNANSLHSEGRAAFAALEQARASLARCVGARPDEVVFTAGATEADNMAVVGIACGQRDRLQRRRGGTLHPHIIITAIEHDAVLQPARLLKRFGFEVTELAPNSDGFISADQVKDALQPDTVLVSVMLANNEIGAIEPVAEIARVAHEAGALMHTDAVQALGKIAVSVKELGVDALSISAHKVGGPKGVGALVVTSSAPFEPLVRGGGQEAGRRSGTQNVAGAVGFAAAAEAGVKTLNDHANHMRALRDELYAGLCARPGVCASVTCTPGSDAYLPNIVNVCVAGIESETLILRFDKLGVAVSGGSACSSHSLEPSHVLTALGVPRDQALCSLRLSIGPTTTKEDISVALQAFDYVIDWKG